ncbi:MAG: undecaprenyl-phosphate galactose phosphotransferase WbaP, partial [Actinomycetota bacterium]
MVEGFGRLTTGASENPDRHLEPGVWDSGELIRRHKYVRRTAAILALLLSDVLIGLGALGVAFGGSVFAEAGRQSVADLERVMLAGVLPSLMLWILLRSLLGLYPGYGVEPAQELRLQTYSSVLTLAVVSVVLFAMGMGGFFFHLLPIGIFGLVLAVPVVRSGTKWVLRRADLWGKPVVVLGEHAAAARLVRTMKKDGGQGFRPVAVFSEAGEGPGETLPDEVPWLGGLEDAPVFAHASGINTAVLAVRGLRQAHTDSLADWASTRFERVIVVPSLAGLTTSAIAARDLSGVLGVEVKHNLLDPRARRIKRAIDLFGVIVGGMLISPVLLALAVLIKLDSPGPVFFSQTRVGAQGREFRCWKFRTMRQDAEEMLLRLLETDPMLRAEWELSHKLQRDPRVTRIGQFLRKTSLDELPQLWNVLKGEMSLVGPRPIVEAEIPKYVGSYDLYTRVTPGITGLWQVRGRSSISYEERVSLDTYYVRNWSVWLDLIILFR